jgi:hypothetical protein
MSRLLTISFMTLGLLANSPAFASSRDCACDEQCAVNCAKGKSAHFPCKTCDCAKGEGCKHGKCALKKHVTVE